MKASGAERLDRLLARRGLFPSRTAAARAVRAGQVRIGRDGPAALRPSQEVSPDQDFVIEGPPPFVSRGGVKLENALEGLGLGVEGAVCLDVGASTGGFTDCLLKRGAASVIALDVAYGQIHNDLRNDPRVTVIERKNARGLEPADLPFVPGLATIDVSFISLRKVLPAVAACLAPDGEILAMVKPQFELGRERVGRGGVVRDADDRREAVVAVADFATGLGLSLLGVAPSGLPGPKGNRETFLRLGRSGDGFPSGTALCQGIDL
jgi:23S rRNA (cytidine1920-2'-O)/16S rRNA (cytidine1409-2'-O)-methyltransferase